MVAPPMRICMDSSDWLKGIVNVHEDGGMGSSSPSGELISSSRPPVMERRLRPQQEQALKCPRCDSTHTKFCYYNNYSLSQPRYFCKTCRRYWTKGGSLRNVPVGGGCRKNKRSASKKPSEQPVPHHPAVPSFQGGTDLHLSFSGVQFPHLDSLTDVAPRNLNFMECKYNPMLGLSSPGDLDLMMNTKFGAMVGSSRGHIFMGEAAGVGLGETSHGFAVGGFHGVSPLGFSAEGNHGAFVEACQRLAVPFEAQEETNAAEVIKSDDRILSLEWQEQCCAGAGAGRESGGYSDNLGLWAGMINVRGPSTTI